MKQYIETWERVVEDPKIFKPDKWQADVLKTEGNISIRAGRQVGKSTIISRKAAKFALQHDKSTTLIIAAAQRQSSLLFEKVRGLVEMVHQDMLKKARLKHRSEWQKARKRRDLIKRFQDKYGIYAEAPTQTKMYLKNGSKIYSLPAGKSGAFIRGFTLDLLIADEAAYIPESVWTAVRPMIAVSKKKRRLGWLVLLSTPFGKGGFFYNSFYDDDFRQWHISSESCPRIPREFLKKERSRLSKVEYAQEYKGEFIDDFNQFFPTQLIKERMTFIEWDEAELHQAEWDFYLGVDVARYGQDENAFVLTCRNRNTKKLKVVKVMTTERKSLTDTAAYIIMLDKKYRLKAIFIDSAGLGAGLHDLLLERISPKSKVVGLENARRTLEDDRKKKLFKEDLYSNAAVLMEKTPPVIDIISNLKLQRSLKSMTFEYTMDKNLRIYGNYSHLSEAFVRSLWCVKSKHLKLFIA